MKNLLLIWLFILISGGNSAQNSWVKLLPDTGTAIKMIPTIDGKYALLTQNSLGNYIMYKYDDNGIMEWRKELPFKVSDFIQLSNGNYAFIGYKSFNDSIGALLVFVNSFGDTISTSVTRYLYAQYTGFSFIIEARIGEIWATIGTGGAGLDSIFINRYNFQGDLLLKNSLDKYSSIVKVNQDTFLFVTNIQTYPNYIYNFQIIDSSLNILYNNQYFVRLLNSQLIRKTIDNGFILHDLCSVCSDKGLVKLSPYLDSLWTIPFSDYWPYSGEMDSPRDLIVTSDGGYAFCGNIYWFFQYSVYLIKTDEYGNSQIAQSYFQTVADNVVNLLQAPDGGYVMFQYSQQAGHTIWLVKTNADGTVPVEQIPAYIQSEVTLYPNPVSDFLNINFHKNFNGEIKLYNLMGQQITCNNIYSEPIMEINMSDFSKGIYIMIITDYDSKKIITKKIIKQ